MLWELSWVFWKNFVKLYLGRVGDVPGRSGSGGVSTKVETDVAASTLRAVGSQRLIPLAGDGGRPSRPDVPVLERSRELLEQAFDKGVAVFQMCSFLVLLPLVPRLHDCLFYANSVLILQVV